MRTLLLGGMEFTDAHPSLMIICAVIAAAVLLWLEAA